MKKNLLNALFGAILLIAGIIGFSSNIVNVNANPNENEGTKYMTGICMVDNVMGVRCSLPDPQGPCSWETECTKY